MAENAVRADQREPAQAPAPKLTGAGIGRLVTVLASAVAIAAIFFLAAGTLDATRAWIYYGGLVAYQVVASAVLLARFPAVVELVNERGRPFKHDVKSWDKAFAVVYTLLLAAEPAVAGLDVGRWHASSVPVALAGPALVLTLFAYAFVHWAMVENKYAETGVRIQTDRRQEVVSTGPYGLVRHPFYAALVVVQLVYPLAVGSLSAYLPAVAIVILFVWRTAREDATLRAELPGYAEYATRVPHRLVPGVW